MNTLAVRNALIFLLLLTLPGFAQPFQKVKDGVEYRAAKLGGAVVHQLRFNPSKARLKLLLAKDHGETAMLVGNMAQKSKVFFAVNASYFDRQLNPLGYLQRDQQVIVPGFQTGGAFGGLFLLSGGKARVLQPKQFRPGKHQLALQCGPRLLVKGKAIPGIHSTKPGVRTGIAVDRKGRICLFACARSPGIDLAKLPNLLLKKVSAGGLEAFYALNLDGGSSTQMWMVTEKVKATLPSLVRVPVGLGVEMR